ncbi:MAG TPA: hypothetical protein VFW70_00450 [Methylomirabilota bacterium]|nr:hypothetical protein [Methylomirabilota bacterium]
MRNALLLLALLLATLAAPAAAEHEVYYRYTVLGYVKDAAGKPRPGEGIELIREKTGFSYLGETDAEGLFVIVARLGDESAGEALTLRHGALRTQVTARFDVANHTDERGTRVDLLAGKAVERPTWFHSTLMNFLSRR